MNDKLDGRQIYSPKGRDQIEDLRILADCIIQSGADLFNQGNQPMWINGSGALVMVTPSVLSELIKTHVVIKVPVDHGTADKPAWKVEFRAVELDEMTLRTMLKEDVGLVRLLPKWPSAPVQLSEQIQREIRHRLAIGESRDLVAAYYKVDPEVIRRLAG